ncbi:hypothetical protein LTR94_035275, partial [Friedmanniomyces endolithicus]
RAGEGDRRKARLRLHCRLCDRLARSAPHPCAAVRQGRSGAGAEGRCLLPRTGHALRRAGLGQLSHRGQLDGPRGAAIRRGEPRLQPHAEARDRSQR